jgi:cytochrome b involved in lipid metabolism
MTTNKKTSLALGIAVVAIAGITAVVGNAPQNKNSYTPTTVPTTTSSTTVTSTSTAQNPGTYTLAQVALHNSASSCWTAINGGVYDVTTWINQHPGGPEAILSLCGTDGSAAFNGQHGGQARPAAELASFKIGTLIQ